VVDHRDVLGMAVGVQVEVVDDGAVLPEPGFGAGADALRAQKGRDGHGDP
jgi:hypothetical protein